MKERCVLTPEWWDTEEGKWYLGKTDAVDTYCCCTVPAWFVRIPQIDYEGYFNVSDLTVVRKIVVRESNDAFLPELWAFVENAEIVHKTEDDQGTLRTYQFEYPATRDAQIEAILQRKGVRV